MKNIKGEKYGRLTVVSFSHKRNGKYFWIFVCDCGNTKTISLDNVKHGTTKSCGCLKKENSKKTGHKNKTHGDSKTRFYNIWAGMRNRCNNKKDPAYKHYGGRGIKVCSDWENYILFKKDMFSSFEKADKKMKRPSIERLDNDKGYNIDNCILADSKTQVRNRRVSHLITYQGETKCLAEWAEIKNMKYDTLWSRIVVHKLTPEQAIERPHYYRKRWYNKEI